MTAMGSSPDHHGKENPAGRAGWRVNKLWEE
jgi:hypothetical protein